MGYLGYSSDNMVRQYPCKYTIDPLWIERKYGILEGYTEYLYDTSSNILWGADNVLDGILGYEEDRI